jgi:hypothetical protein
MKAPDNAQGDLAVVYSFAKAMDPGSVVREGEMDMANATASQVQQVNQMIQSITAGKRLPPEVRVHLIDAARQKIAGLRAPYDQQYQRYSELAHANGFSPQEIVGSPLYKSVEPIEEQYIRAHGGTPRDPNAPLNVQSSQQSQAGFGLQQDPRVSKLSPEQASAYDAWWKANPNPSPRQLLQFVSTIGVNIAPKNAQDIITAKRKGAGISHDVQIKPDISDVRGGNNTSAQDAINATARGVPDTLSMGLLDKGVALADTVAKGGTFDQNLSRQYAISDYDQANHPVARFAGQALGGAALPMGDVSSLTNLSLKGAGYGAGYGLGSSRQLSDIPANVLGGAAVGAAVPAVLGKFFKPKAGGVDPLVDPVTGELNQPMDSMNPAQRGAVMQDFGMKTVTPGMVGGRSARIMEQAFNNLPGSAGHMEDVNSAASAELRRSMQGVAQQFGTSKTLSEGGSAVQSGALARNDRAEGVVGKAYHAIPIADTADTSKANTVGLLQELTGRFQSNPKLAEAMHDPKLAQYLDAFQNGNVSWKDMKNFRSAIGEKIGDMRFGESSSTSDLRALYGALSQDMRDTASAHGPRALRAFERANNLNRQNEELIQGALTRILGKDGNLPPEKAAAAIQAMTKGGKSTGDLKTLAQIRSATIKSGAWDEIASTLIHLGGQPANSEGRAFQPQTFVNWYADMAEPARRMLFKPELRKSLDGFVAMNQQLGRLKGARQHVEHFAQRGRKRHSDDRSRIADEPDSRIETRRDARGELRTRARVDQSSVR